MANLVRIELRASRMLELEMKGLILGGKLGLARSQVT